MTTVEVNTKVMEKAMKKASGKTDVAPPKRIMKELEVELSDTEKLERTQTLLAAMQAKDNLIATKTLQTSEINAEIKTAQKHVREVYSALQSGKEKREVGCIELHLYELNTVELRREDTNALVEKRAMTAVERQLGFPVVDAPKAPAAGAPITATIGEQVELKTLKVGDVVDADFAEVEETPWTEGSSPAPAPAPVGEMCGKELDGRICSRPLKHRGAHNLGKSTPQTGSTEITAPDDLIEAAGEAPVPEGTEAPKRRGRPKGSRNKPKDELN